MDTTDDSRMRRYELWAHAPESTYWALCKRNRRKIPLLRLALTPLNLTLAHANGCNVTLTLHARSHEGDANVLRVRISWNGRWDNGVYEMGAGALEKSVGLCSGK